MIRFTLFWCLTLLTAAAQPVTYEYASRETGPLLLDLQVPEQASVESYPVILWFHGGGWRQGSRENRSLVAWLLDEGFAIVSADYRLSSVATFPAQQEDSRAALSWIRKHAEAHQLDPNKVITAGLSAGAQLASLTALADGHTYHPVAGVLHFYGPSDFVQMSRYAKAPEAPLNQPSSNVYQLFGGPLLANPTLASQASPVTYLDPSDPRLLILVGDEDSLMTQRQCRRLHEAALKMEIESQLHIIEGAGHGGPEFSDEVRRSLILTFLQSLNS